MTTIFIFSSAAVFTRGVKERHVRPDSVIVHLRRIHIFLKESFNFLKH